MPIRIKIKDIAALAEVSLATVSLALNNKPGVNEKTRARVLQIAKSLTASSEFHQNLKQITTGSIRFLKIVKHGRTLNRDHDVFISSYLEGLDQEARILGFTVEVGTLETDDMAKVLKTIKDVKAEGFIILGTELTASDVALLTQAKRPLVFMDTYFDYEHAHFVNMDNSGEVFKVIRYLANMGHREVGYLRSDCEVRNFKLRDEGFRKACRHLKISSPENHTLTVDSTFDGAYTDMLKHLKRRRKLPTAFFVVNDVTAYGCIKAFKEKGFRIPEDISIIGFDDLPMSAILDPALTTVRVMNKQLGQTAMRLVSRQVNEGDKFPITKVALGGELVIRDSVRKL